MQLSNGLLHKIAFNTLKEKLTTKPILVVPDPYKPFELNCDACGECVGAALHEDGHVVAYESRRLRDAEKHMGIYEKELLAIIHAINTWKLGADFTVNTDHQSQRYFLT